VTTTATEHTTASLLLEWDRRRPRSQQRQFGMSELGDCRRRAGYRLAGVQPTNQGGSVQAVMGTGLHAHVAEVLRDLQAEGVIPADALVEHEVSFAGILGHLDLYVEPEVTDTKTTSSRWLEKLKVNGPSLSHLWQTHGYAAALIAEGRTVRRINIDYIARDTGEEWRWSGPFEAKHVRDALNWVNEVRSTELEFLARDHAPDSPWCEHCPFFDRCWEGGYAGRDPRSVLYVENPDAAEWATKLEDARARKKAAADDEAEAKGALDALRPDGESVTYLIPGHDRALRWTVSKTRRIDTTQVRKDYIAAGRTAPEKTSETTRLDLVSPEVAS
jgi:CRISPR/Cas system-associated exonuclease Cas4 (RecB family)